MLVLQILIVPVVALLLLSAIFMIGVAGTGLTGYPTQSDLPGARVDEPDPTQTANSALPATSVPKFLKHDEDICL